MGAAERGRPARRRCQQTRGVFVSRWIYSRSEAVNDAKSLRSRERSSGTQTDAWAVKLSYDSAPEIRTR